MRTQPPVTILMNCYNGERYLHEAIESIIAQTYQNWELVFWDNCSTDRSAEIFKSYSDPRMKYFLAPDHTNLGGGRARAWPLLIGDFIAFLDTDDVWLPQKLEQQIPLFSDPEVGIVISDVEYFNERRSRLRFGGNYPPTGWVFERMMTNYFAPLLSLVVRRSAVERLPRAIDPEFNAITDFDLVVRLSRISKVALHPTVLAKSRIHTGSFTWQNPQPFLIERERWIAKQVVEDPTLLMLHGEAVQTFVTANERGRVIVDLLAGRRLKAIHRMLRTRFDHWQSWVLLAACFTPYASRLFAWRKQRQFELA